MKTIFILPFFLLFSCQRGYHQQAQKLTSSWPTSLEKIIILCSSEQQTLEVTKKNYQQKHDCRELPGASHVVPIFKKSAPKNVKVSAQAIQHLTLMMEGPHVDLTNWKSRRSEFITLETPGKDNQFKLAEGAFGDFPKFSNEELKEAVREQLKSWGGGKIDTRWLELATKCGDTPDKYPCGLGTSEYKVHLEFPGERTMLELSIARPMGC